MKDQPAPKYIQLKQEILTWIVTAQFKPHDRLPSENEVARQFEMSRQTVRQALGDLEQEGWLYRTQGKGTFVADTQAAERKPAPQGMTIGMITTYISDYIFPTIVRGVESSLREHSARLLLSSTDNEKTRERESLESMLHEPLAGLIIEPTKSAEGNPNFDFFLALDARQIPYVMLNERYSDIDAPCLRVDDEMGGYRAVDYLFRHGHRRIAGFFKTDDYQGVHRMRGFLRAFRERKEPVAADWVVRYTTEEKTSRPLEALSRMLEREPAERPTAIVCYNDELAVNLLDIVRQRGLSVPDDLSMIGYDDSSLAVATEVKLTSLVHPKTAMGTDAVELLMKLIGKRAPRSAQLDIVYEPVLIERDSVKPLV